MVQVVARGVVCVHIFSFIFIQVFHNIYIYIYTVFNLIIYRVVYLYHTFSFSI
jgi:hypothetical protein